MPRKDLLHNNVSLIREAIVDQLLADPNFKLTTSQQNHLIKWAEDLRNDKLHQTTGTLQALYSLDSETQTYQYAHCCLGRALVITTEEEQKLNAFRVRNGYGHQLIVQDEPDPETGESSNALSGALSINAAEMYGLAQPIKLGGILKYFVSSGLDEQIPRFQSVFIKLNDDLGWTFEEISRFIYMLVDRYHRREMNKF